MHGIHGIRGVLCASYYMLPRHHSQCFTAKKCRAYPLSKRQSIRCGAPTTPAHVGGQADLDLGRNS